MNTLKKVTSASLLLAAILCFMVSGSTNAQGLKIGYIADERLFSEYTAFQKAQEEFETEQVAWEDEASALQQELQELIDEYEKQKLILSDEKKREREARIRTKREALDAFTRQLFGPGGTAERKEAELMQPINQNIRKAIETVALEGNYDVIFTLSGIGYIKETYDVTDRVIEVLDELEQ